MDHDEDAQVMAQFVASRDRQLFDRLFQRYRRPMVTYAQRFVRHPARAEELAQEVFVRVYTTKRYAPNTRFKTWLYTVATNVCLNEVRRFEHRVEFSSLDHATHGPDLRDSSAATPESHAQAHELGRQIERALAALPDNQRTALELVRQEGLSHDEVADVLSVSVPAVKSLVHRALETLRREVQRYQASGESRDPTQMAETTATTETKEEDTRRKDNRSIAP